MNWVPPLLDPLKFKIIIIIIILGSKVTNIHFIGICNLILFQLSSIDETRIPNQGVDICHKLPSLRLV